MTHPERKIIFRHVTRQDVERVANWLQDEDVADSWFGRYSYGDPAHLGYHPEETLTSNEEAFNSIFDDPEHVIFSVDTEEGEHIGEAHIAIEESIGGGQISILIGAKEKWHEGYGTATAKELIRQSFEIHNLYHIWADVPTYNEAAHNMFLHLGFTHEGTLRQSRPHHGARFDSVILGMLIEEYS